MTSPSPLTVAGRLAIVVAAAAGLIAAAVVDGLLAAAGAARVVALEVGVAGAPLVLLALSAPVRRELAANAATMLLVFGAAWTLSPFIDEHLTGAVVMGGALPDLIHHLAGWPALIGGARLSRRPDPSLTS